MDTPKLNSSLENAQDAAEEGKDHYDYQKLMRWTSIKVSRDEKIF